MFAGLEAKGEGAYLPLFILITVFIFLYVCLCNVSSAHTQPVFIWSVFSLLSIKKNNLICSAFVGVWFSWFFTSGVWWYLWNSYSGDVLNGVY